MALSDGHYTLTMLARSMYRDPEIMRAIARMACAASEMCGKLAAPIEKTADIADIPAVGATAQQHLPHVDTPITEIEMVDQAPPGYTTVKKLADELHRSKATLSRLTARCRRVRVRGERELYVNADEVRALRYGDKAVA